MIPTIHTWHYPFSEKLPLFLNPLLGLTVICCIPHLLHPPFVGSSNIRAVPCVVTLGDEEAQGEQDEEQPNYADEMARIGAQADASGDDEEDDDEQGSAQRPTV